MNEAVSFCIFKFTLPEGPPDLYSIMGSITKEGEADTNRSINNLDAPLCIINGMEKDCVKFQNLFEKTESNCFFFFELFHTHKS
jgi:hypothetical protein